MTPITDPGLLRQLRANRLLWGVIALATLISGLVMMHLGWKVQARAVSSFALIMGACAIICLTYRRLHHDANLFFFASTINLMVCCSFAIGLMSYTLASANMPLMDSAFIRADSFFGLDWRDYVAWVGQYPMLGTAMELAYYSFGMQIIALICLLFAFKHSAHAQRFTLSFFIAGLITVIVAALLPALGGYAYYELSKPDFATLHPSAGRIYNVLHDIRAGKVMLVSFPMEGLAAFPSFHAALAVLLSYMVLPLRWLRAMLIPVNVLMLLSTPVQGSHYWVDVFSGVATAMFGIWAASRILPGRVSG